MKKITGKEMVGKFYEDYDGKELGKEMSNFVNSFSFDKKGFIDELKEREDKTPILNVSLLWLLKLEYFKDNKYFDLRNEYSVETGVKLAKSLHDEVVHVSGEFNYEGNVSFEDYEEGAYLIECDDKESIGGYKSIPIEREIMLVETMGRTHRTLQQSFSGIVFESLLLFPEFEEKLKKMDYTFHKTPLI